MASLYRWIWDWKKLGKKACSFSAASYVNCQQLWSDFNDIVWCKHHGTTAWQTFVFWSVRISQSFMSCYIFKVLHQLMRLSLNLIVSYIKIGLHIQFIIGIRSNMHRPIHCYNHRILRLHNRCMHVESNFLVLSWYEAAPWMNRFGFYPQVDKLIAVDDCKNICLNSNKAFLIGIKSLQLFSPRWNWWSFLWYLLWVKPSTNIDEIDVKSNR